VRTAAGIVLAGLGAVTLFGGSFSPKAAGFAALFLVAAAGSFSFAAWEPTSTYLLPKSRNGTASSLSYLLKIDQQPAPDGMRGLHGGFRRGRRELDDIRIRHSTRSPW